MQIAVNIAFLKTENLMFGKHFFLSPRKRQEITQTSTELAKTASWGGRNKESVVVRRKEK